jgi:hypothetical protein
VAYSLDGRLLAAACLDGTLLVWNATSLQLVAQLRDTGECHALAFHPIEPRLAAFSVDATARIWDTVRFDELFIMHTGNLGTNVAMFTPDGTTLVTSGRAAAVEMLETSRPSCEQRDRFVQMLTASALQPFDHTLTEDAAATLAADRLISDAVRSATLTALKRSGDHLNWMVSDAIICMQQRENGGAEDLLETAERKLRIAIARKEEPGPLAVMGELKYRRGAFEEAIATLRSSVALYERRGASANARVLGWLALSYHATGNDDAARQCLARALAVRADNAAGDTAEQNVLAEAERRIRPEPR